MSHVGVSSNIFQPNKRCLSCKYWARVVKDPILNMTVGGYCKPGYCKRLNNERRKKK